MGLLNLPTELNDQIITQITPDGIESYALTCRTTYIASERYIAQHNQRKRLYEDFSLMDEHAWTGLGPNAQASDQHGLVPMYTPLQLTQRIAHEPMIARYIRKANLSSPIMALQNYSEHFETFKEQIRQDTKVEQLVRGSIYLRDRRQEASYWLERMVTNEDISLFSTCFLLTRLPNLEELALPLDWEKLDPPVISSPDVPAWRLESHQKAWALLDDKSRKANAAQEHNASLGKLRVLKPNLPDIWEIAYAFEFFIPLVAISSVKEFYAGSCAHTTKLTERIARYPTFGKHLTIIELAGTAIDAEGMSEILRCTTKLKTLRMIYSGKQDANCYLDTNVLVNGIGQYVGHSLETLALSCPQPRFGPTPDIGSSLMSMIGFQVLQRLELGARLMEPIDYNPASTISSSSDDDGALVVRAPRLAKLIPHSVRVFVLIAINDEHHQHCLNEVFKGFEDDRTGLPNLSIIEVRWATPMTSQGTGAGFGAAWHLCIDQTHFE